MINERVFNITFNEAIFNDGTEKMVNALEEVSGVHGATPEVSPEGALLSLSIRIEKDIDLPAC